MIPSVFIDASILIAAAISAAGRARDLLLAAIRGEIRAVISSLALQETERNLQRKAPMALPALQVLHGAWLDTVDPPAALVLDVAKVVHVKDAAIIAAAIAAQAKYLATYDRKHLLSQQHIIAQHFAIIVATPGEILNEFGL